MIAHGIRGYLWIYIVKFTIFAIYDIIHSIFNRFYIDLNLDRLVNDTMTQGNTLDVKFSISIVIIILYMMYECYRLDKENAHILQNALSHKEVDLPPITDIQKLQIERVIDQYRTKESMNKSNISQVMSSIAKGMLRGAVGGAIVGDGVQGAASGAAVFGIISGLMTAYNINYSRVEYLIPSKAT
jgi:hypothetical protein